MDEVTIAYMKEHSQKDYTIYEADEDAEYDAEYTIDLDTLEPTIAFPHLPENTKTVKEAGEVKIDQVVIGSCTNGRISDLFIDCIVLLGVFFHIGNRYFIHRKNTIFCSCLNRHICNSKSIIH